MPAAKKTTVKRKSPTPMGVRPKAVILDDIPQEEVHRVFINPPTFVDHMQLHAAPNVQVAGDILSQVCFDAAKRSGWWQGANGQDVREWPAEYYRLWVGAKLGLVHTEVSEAIEGFRKGKMDEHIPELTAIEVELGDAVIRIFDLAGGMGLDLGKAIGMKLHYNSLRADHKPEHRATEGGKKF